MNTSQQRQPYYFLPFVLLFMAVCFLLLLLSTIQQGVFFSGDAGLKYLVARQIADGGAATSLHLNAPDWVQKIWSQGFYPFKEPFVYDTVHGRIVSFPPAFQWLSSWMFKWFGFNGLYIIPATSLVSLWIIFIHSMLQLKVKPLIIAIAFLALAFASPLTMYGALYWEHTLAVFLFFPVIVFALRPGLKNLQAFLPGLIGGTSVWFRPEMLLLCLLFVLVVLYNRLKIGQKVTRLFIAGLLIGMSSFLFYNGYVYGNILGAHSFQLSATENTQVFFTSRFIILSHLNARLVLSFPLIVLFYILTVCLLWKKKLLGTMQVQLTVIIVLFLIITPFLLPNAGGKQWGPRYFLPVIPIVVVVLCIDPIAEKMLAMKKWLWFLTIAILLYGCYVNVIKAYVSLEGDYTFRVKPGLEFLKKENCDIIVIQNQFIAQEFAALFDTRKIFLAEDQQSFNRLTQLLKASGVSKIMYVSHDAGFERLPVNALSKSHELKQIGNYYFALYLID